MLLWKRHKGRNRPACQNVRPLQGAFSAILSGEQGRQPYVAVHKRSGNGSELLFKRNTHVLRCTIFGIIGILKNAPDEYDFGSPFRYTHGSADVMRLHHRKIYDQEVGDKAGGFLHAFRLLAGELCGYRRYKGVCQGRQGAYGFPQAQQAQRKRQC